jgi:hypothetical protein
MTLITARLPALDAQNARQQADCTATVTVTVTVTVTATVMVTVTDKPGKPVQVLINSH